MKLYQLLSLVFLLLIGFAGLTRWQQVDKPLIMTDGQGYYAYLPATFLYQDLQFTFVDSINEAYYDKSKRARYVVQTGSGNVNKYFAGTSVVQLPFFLSACLIAKLIDVPLDGYSWPFQLMVGVAAIVCLLIGMLFLGKVLLRLRYRTGTVLFTLVAIVFGTNLLYYALYEPSMSHVYSFFTISAFLFFAQRSITEHHRKSLYMASIAFGLTVLIRPVNGSILLALPVLTGGTTGFLLVLERHLQKSTDIILAVGLGCLIMAIQPFFYWLQTGSPWSGLIKKKASTFYHPS